MDGPGRLMGSSCGPPRGKDGPVGVSRNVQGSTNWRRFGVVGGLSGRSSGDCARVGSCVPFHHTVSPAKQMNEDRHKHTWGSD